MTKLLEEAIMQLKQLPEDLQNAIATLSSEFKLQLNIEVLFDPVGILFNI
ncbi:hypothetical protein [Roseofilum casamattae]|uniref:Uncharacterized protein n=1 Tax=Roseofilum casamattae BLCC-M143 TaxID=3022442 RepID=A0ABT7BR15_9CYAN|nr:hypothetical protein [Roseofilum casamattae]MDJ1181630.1 hypothetical protein [Roseofilum casamattae BLCC-M143]